VSENGGEWPQGPRPPQPSRMPQGPRGPQVPRMPQGPRGLPDPRMPRGPQIPQNPRIPQRPQPPRPLPDRDPWRPDDHLRPQPPQPPQPTQRAERLARPETTQWYPAQASPSETYPQDQYGEQGRHSERDHHGEQGYYPGDAGSEDDYDAGGRFVPGFAGAGDGDGDYDYEQPERGGHRARRQDSHGGHGGGGSHGGGGRGGRRSRRRFRWIAPLAALLVIFVPLAAGGIYAYSLYQDKYHPADYSGDGTGSIVVQVTSGQNATDLGPKLVKLGVVASSRAFVLAAEHSSNPAGLLPGFYRMHLHMKASLAYALLLDPKNLVQVTVTIPEGLRLTQIVSWLGAKSGIPASKYQAALKDPAALGLPSYANGKPEGYLFPATYVVQPHETALGVLKGMVQRFGQEAAFVNLPAAAKQVHLSPAQVITMASLVQAEGGRLSDYPKIARVIYNRLAQGIPLQLDSTVLYGLNKFGIVATDAELSSPSPYNTYKHKGLTPGPIDSPGNAAIQAVLHPAPASDKWLYFVTVNPKTGETLFTSSQAQFEQFRQELQKYLEKS